MSFRGNSIPLQLMKNQKPVEFIALMAFMMAIGAFSIDAILPAMQVIGDDFGITNTNDNQLLVSLVFLGLAIGQIFFFFLSERSSWIFLPIGRETPECFT